MTLAIDAVLIFAAVFCMWAGTRRGFVRSVMGLVSALVSAFTAYAFTPSVAGWIAEKFFAGRISGSIEETIRSISLDTATDFFDLDRILSDLPDSFTRLMSRYHVDLSYVSEVMRGITRADETSVHNLAERIASPTVTVLSSVIAFAALFAVAFLVMSLITALLDLIFRMPVLNSANMFFGFLAGLAEAVVFVSVLAVLFDRGVRYLGAYDPTFFGDEAVDNTILCNFILKHNILSFITDVLG